MHFRILGVCMALYVLPVLGCIDPPMRREIYTPATRRSSDVKITLETSNANLNALGGRGRHPSAPLIRIVQPDGTIWKIRTRGNNPRDWSVTEERLDGSMDQVRLRRLESLTDE